MMSCVMEAFIFGQFYLGRAAYRLTRHVAGEADQEIALRPKALDVLAYLLEHAGRIISQDEFLSRLWPTGRPQQD